MIGFKRVHPISKEVLGIVILLFLGNGVLPMLFFGLACGQQERFGQDAALVVVYFG